LNVGGERKPFKCYGPIPSAMSQFEAKLKTFIRDNSIQCEHFVFEQSCHSVAEAAKATNASEEDFIKNICMIDTHGNLIVAIVKGEDRASTSQIQKALSTEKPRLATADEIFEKTGYPCGGVPSFGYQARFLIDPRILEKEIIYTSGGSENSLVKISTRELQRANSGTIIRIRK